MVLLLGVGYLLLVRWVLPSVLQTLKFRRLVLRQGVVEFTQLKSDPSISEFLFPTHSVPLPPFSTGLAILSTGWSKGIFYQTQVSGIRKWNILLRFQLELEKEVQVQPTWLALLSFSSKSSIRLGGNRFGWGGPISSISLGLCRVVDRVVERIGLSVL